MKKFYQISTVILFIGIILLVIGKVNNGDRGFDFSNINSFRSAKWHDEDAYHDNDDYEDDDYEDDDYDEVSRKKQAVETINIPAFSKIKLDMYRPNVHISLGEKYQIKVSGPKSKKVSASVKGQELLVSDHNKHSFTSFMDKNYEYAVEIIVPKRIAIKELTGTCSEGDMLVEDVTIPHINLKLNEGDMVVNKVKTKNAKIYLEDGDLKVTSSILASGNLIMSEGDLAFINSQFKLTATLNDGDVAITNSKLLDKSIFTLNDGDFKMVNAPKLDYDLSTDRESDIRFQGTYRTSHFVKKIGNLPVLKVISTDGDIIID